MTAAVDDGELVAAALACRRGERLVFCRLGFVLGAGGGLLLTGANGSGKSSLLRVLASLLAPAAGAVSWGGVPVDRDLAGYRARLHYVGHRDATKPAMRVRETLAFWSEMRRGDAARIDPALATMGLDGLGDWPCRWLSAGQRHRLALARLLAAPAPLWLLDEPTAALDADGEQRLLSAIRGHRAAGGRVVIATHQNLPLDGVDTLSLDDFAALARAEADPFAAGF
ncbi:MAG TPA: heme ABC exporter ATP-binding protein CcmA [Stellaceae bacterium]|nr:heme ABC exporter ATP-binding protein CcmA [Stellaceae bacterium]